MNAFITGSMAYGTPGPDSDIDMVVLVDAPTLALLQTVEAACGACCGTGTASRGGSCFCCMGTGIRTRIPSQIQFEYDDDDDHANLRFGRLNLIAIQDEGMFEVWRAATEFLKTKAPVTRERAVEYMQKKRHRYRDECNEQ